MTATTEAGNSLALFEHTKRSQWGLAILAWEAPDTRGYQFQDGELRTFKLGYYQLLKEVDRPFSEAQVVHRELGAKLDLSIARKEIIAETAEKGKPNLMTVADQVMIFNHLFPNGFRGETWSKDVRGEGASRALKKYRDPAIKKAAELLNAERLNAAIAAGEFDQILDDATLVARTTSLVPASKDWSILKEFQGEGAEAFARALVDLLHGEANFGGRFARFAALLEDGGGWIIVTLFLGLLNPDEHIIVRPSSFRQQAQWMAPRLRNATEPEAMSYVRFLGMAQRVREELVAADADPRDLIDVHDFIWHTMRPSARKMLPELKKAAG
ncbi:MAG: hypothetical protein ACI9OJ_001021 [Myxococcota bacterium]|jgi:hypothetical protein